MPRLKPFPQEDLDVEALQRRLRKIHVHRTPHIDDVELVKGRPPWETVKGFLESEASRLARAITTHSGRILLFYYASSKYDLRVVVRIEGRDLYVVSYNWLKKKFKHPTNKVPRLKWLK